MHEKENIEDVTRDDDGTESVGIAVLEYSK